MFEERRVLLPAHIFEQAKDKQELQQSIVRYMKRYPKYSILRVKDGFAICRINV